MNLISALAVLPAIDNPLDGVLPDFDVFGVEFTELWQKAIAGVWGLAIIAVIIFVIVGALKMGSASNASNVAVYKDAQKQFIGGLIALGVLAGLAVIVGAVLAFFG